MPLDEIKFVQSEFGFAHTTIKMDAETLKIDSVDGLEGNEAGLKQLVDLYSEFNNLLQQYASLLKGDLEHIRTAGETLKVQDQTSGDQFKNK